MRALALGLALLTLTGCAVATRAGSTDEDRAVEHAACEHEARRAMKAPKPDPTPAPERQQQLAAGLAMNVAAAAVPALSPLSFSYDPEAGVRSRTWRCMRAGGWR